MHDDASFACVKQVLNKRANYSLVSEEETKQNEKENFGWFTSITCCSTS